MKILFNYLMVTMLFTCATFTTNVWALSGGAPPPQLCGQDPDYSNCFSLLSTVSILDNVAVSSSITISGAIGTIGYMDLSTNIIHTFPGDLDITLQSPAGTIVTLTTDNGGGNNNIFNGTIWNDNYTNLVTDFAHADNVTSDQLAPEEAFGAFIGEDPNGVWTITISDDAGGDEGELNYWGICLYTFNSVTPSATSSFSNTTLTPINSLSTNISTITVSGLTATILDVNAITNIVHTFPNDLDITLQSPAGTIVTLTTDNGAGNDNVFNGTVWDDDANPAGQVPYTSNNGMVTDHTYADLTLASPLVPEGALAAFIGEDPNGVWTISVIDDLSGDVGEFTWQLDIVTCAPVLAASNNYFADTPATLDCLVFDYYDISSSGTLVVSGDDEGVAVALAAPIPFYDDIYSDLVLTTNGYISTSLSDGGSDLSNDCPLPADPSSGSGSRIYIFHSDLVCSDADGGGVFYEYFANSPVLHPDGLDHAAHIFQWVGRQFGEPGAIAADFQAIIFDNGDIIYQYNLVPNNGEDATVGMQHESLANSTTYICDTPGSINPGDIVGFSYGANLLCPSLPPPPNDLCDDAVEIILACGEIVSIDGTNIGATPDGLTDDCNSGSLTDGGGVWYSVLGTGNDITASLCGGASFDTELSIYTGSCTALVCVAGNDDLCGFQSEATWTSVAGTTYYILVHGYSLDDSDNFTLLLDDNGNEANDDCSNAIIINPICGSNTTVSGSTLCATYDNTTDESCTTAATAGTVWYVVYGNGADYSVSTCAANGGSADYDTKISVFSGDCDNLVCVSGNDDTGAFLCSTVSWDTDFGEAYYIMVHGFEEEEGNFTLSLTAGNPVSCNVSGTNISCFGANDGSAIATATGGGLSHTFVWSNGATTSSIANLAPGNYSVTVTDEAGCECIDDIVLTQPEVLAATMSSPEQGNGGTSAFGYNTATILVSGGTTPYHFDWDNTGYVRYDIAYTADGATITVFYTSVSVWEVTISDDNNCRGGDGNDIILGNDLSGANDLLDIINYVIGAQSNATSPNGNINITVDGGNCSGNYSYAWTGPNGFTSNLQDIPNLASGWYSVTVTCGTQSTIGWYWVPLSRRGRNKIDNALLESAPNPFSTTATLSFALPYDDIVQIDLFDMSGKLIANLYHGSLEANEVYEVPLDAGVLPQGAYLCRLSTQQTGEQLSHKIWLMK